MAGSSATHPDTPLSQGEDGNTDCHPPTYKARRWCMTLNNWTEDELAHLTSYSWVKLACQSECGEEETSHLQACMASKNAIRFSTLQKLLPRAHWEKCRNWDASVAYCTKEDTHDGRVRILEGVEPSYEEAPVVDYWDPSLETEWQKEIIGIADAEPDMRKIHWYWSRMGGLGKSELARHYKFHAPGRSILCSGAARDCKFMLAQCIEAKRCPRVIFWDLARDCEDRLSYRAMEEIKNGYCASSKYESAELLFAKPTIIVFANFPPNESKLSADRWVIKQIDADTI